MADQKKSLSIELHRDQNWTHYLATDGTTGVTGEWCISIEAALVNWCEKARIKLTELSGRSLEDDEQEIWTILVRLLAK